jgi:hypothetical protein
LGNHLAGLSYYSGDGIVEPGGYYGWSYLPAYVLKDGREQVSNLNQAHVILFRY